MRVHIGRASVRARLLGSEFEPAAYDRILHSGGVRGAATAAITGRAATPTVDFVNLEAPATAEPEAGDFATLNQPVNRRLVAMQILGQIFDRYDFPSHLSVQHTLTSGDRGPESRL
jgi:hypothetical protein